ncbi:MAG: SDR family oxidoreductase [Oxalobacter sp.]|nr:MAG: SDR family oxidoreductase [Oxalobacter sp.]
MMEKILVTGANGFVGGALCKHLDKTDKDVIRAVRSITSPNETEFDGIDPDGKYDAVLTEVDVVIHLAARVHVMQDTAANPLDAFREVNTYGTLNLARQAAECGVRRFIFLSSVKVNGESGTFSDESAPQPKDPYGVSKWEAEEGLKKICSETGMEVVILRPPLVYGSGVTANFLQLMRAVDRGIPLPLGAIDNRRSLIYIGNLVDVITRCLDHPAVAGKTYLVSDGEDVSTTLLIRKLAKALGRSPRLLPIPSSALRLAGRLLGKGQQMDRLLDSLAVDAGSICKDLDWKPPFTMDEGLKAATEWYRKLRSDR